jgi:Flp pilus assembly protein TadG
MGLFGVRVSQAASRFARNRSGNFAVLTGVSMLPIVLAVGFCVNLAQAYQVKSSLQAALDSAMTSTARNITTGAIKKEDARKAVEKFLLGNSDGKFADKGEFVLDTLVTDDAAKTLEGTAYAYVDSAFPLFGKDPKVSVTSAALYSDKKVEIAMMLDITGSMKADRKKKTDKIGDLQTAAKNAVGLAMKQNWDPQNPRVRVAIIPYAQAVNAGALAGDVVFVEKAGGADLPPAEDAVVLAKADASGSDGSRPDNCSTERRTAKGQADTSDDEPTALRVNNQGKKYRAKVNRDDRMTKCPQAEVIPLTADSVKLLATIETFEADGETAGGIGAQWAYYMLSPKWRTTIRDAGLGNGPADINKNKIAKVAILMTDGEFNTAFAGVKQGDEPILKQDTRARTNAESICSAMKKDGIEVYTVGFQLTEANAKTVLKNCSTPDVSSIKHYFEASTGAELDAAFSEIIKNTERLTLTK